MQPEALSIRTHGEKGLEDMVGGLLGNPRAGIHYQDQGRRIKIGELGRMADPAFGENLSFCGTSSHLFTMFAVALVIINKYNIYVQ